MFLLGFFELGPLGPFRLGLLNGGIDRVDHAVEPLVDLLEVGVDFFLGLVVFRGPWCRPCLCTSSYWLRARLAALVFLASSSLADCQPGVGRGVGRIEEIAT